MKTSPIHKQIGKSLFFCLMLALVPTIATAQYPFLQLYGNQQSQLWGCVVVLPDGGYAIAGSTPDSLGTSMDFYLVRTDAMGNEVWSQRYAKPDSNETANRLIHTEDGGFAIMGTTAKTGSNFREDYAMVKTDSLGNREWARTYGVTGSFVWERGHDIIQTHDKGYIFVGSSGRQGGTSGAMWKLDSLGNQQWQKGWANGTVIRRIEENPDGSYILAADYIYFSTRAVQLIKTDSLGQTIWSTLTKPATPQIPAAHTPKGVFLQADGGYLVAAAINVCQCPNPSELWFIRTDANGDSLWTKTISSPENYILNDAVRTLDGHYALVGYRQLNSSPFTITGFVMKIDSNANILFQRDLPGYALDIPWSVVAHPDSGIVIGGYTGSTNTGLHNDLFIWTGDSTCCMGIPLNAYSDSTRICSGTPVQIWADTLPYPVTWSNGDTGQAITVTQPGTYFYSLTDSLGCQSYSNSITLTSRSGIPPTLNIQGNDSLCNGDSTLLSLSSAYPNYLWSTGDTSQSIWVSQSGSYYGTSSNGCNQLSSDTVNIAVFIPPTIRVGGNQNLCIGDTLLLLATGGQSYQWPNAPSIFSRNDSAWAFPNIQTTYTLTGTDAFGCTGTETFTLTPQALPVPNLGTDTLLCLGQNLILQAGTYSSYLWNTGTTTNTFTINGAQAGTFSYWVEVSNTFGCVGRDTIEVVVDACLGITNPGQEAQFSLHPNPVGGVSWLRYSGGETGQVRLLLFDAQGKRIQKVNWNIQDPYRLDMTPYITGIYWIILEWESESNRPPLRFSILNQ